MDSVTLTGSEVPLSRIGQGTWQISTSGPAAERALDALAEGVRLGMTHLDTAEMYGSGASESLLARLLQERDIARDAVVLASKVLPSNASYDGTLRACEQSLARLGVDVLDLYMLHWPGRYPIEDTMRALETLVERGLVRAIGVSNFDVEELEEAQACLQHVPLAFNQVLYHLRERAIERRLLPFCEREGIVVVSYSPFGQGDFPTAGSKQGKLLEQIGQAHGKTPRQVALRFLSRRTVVIPKAEKTPHVVENAGAAGFTLTDGEVAAIDAAFPPSRRGGLPML